ncbi:MAG: gliding motility-associated C-terminal domain-containing protein, partial [Flavobacteriales bacterium]
GIQYMHGGQKTVTLTISSSNCTNTDSSTINIDSLPVADAGKDTTICANRCVQIGSDSISGNSYSWFPSNTLDTPSTSNPTACPEAEINEYIVTTTDNSTGCENSDTITVSMVTTAVPDAGPDVEICYGDTIQIGSGLLEGQTYEWTPDSAMSDSSSPNPYVHPDSSTIYTVMTTYEGCDTLKDDVMVTVNPLPDVDAVDEAGMDSTEITKGDDIQLIASGAVQYNWSPRDGLDNSGIFNPTASPEDTTTYVVEGVDMNNCVNYDTIKVDVVIPEFWFPSAFTPDRDGKNDRFYVRTQGVKRFELNIFDRSGEVIFHTTDPDQGWNGRIQGKGDKLPEGAYMFNVQGRLSNGKDFNKSEMINLIR